VRLVKLASCGVDSGPFVGGGGGYIVIPNAITCSRGTTAPTTPKDSGASVEMVVGVCSDILFLRLACHIFTWW